ncbi:type I restriction enzyme, R subunit [Desulfonatronum thiosulfatophilum]|uniref:Type I restriction enzyme endonuclease subunit n=1 Tax=Desulfonatronum thiosulfatophilum TaxID=617002 RepID=A0A1G6ET68_9BACT|nr:type I restriction endonuclease subunit R [Desulfonatronum thiosulfatophilum]SDB60616.1 type I restriction enzyme, R subunit [Desulfonatronum thiosulfatophilum]
MDIPSFKEDLISQVPALELLQNLGYIYLAQEETFRARGGRLAGVLLESVLVEQLRTINVIRFKGREYPFSEGNILAAVQALKDVADNGLVQTNEKVYDLLKLGRAMQQSIDGDTKSFQLDYIDWKHPENNAYHVAEEFAVERGGSHETRRPDVVLFVNGIPFVVIECKRPDLKDAIGQAVSQQIRNQQQDQIPRLFHYAQLLLAVSKNEAKYATVGTPAKFWAVWKEELGPEETASLKQLVSIPLTEEQVDKVLVSRKWLVKTDFAGYGSLERQITEQDRALYALCRPERLLELTYRFMLFDAGEKKVARYQQYFCVNKIMERIRRLQQDGRRQGGVVWHTQGSGKSLTMVMLAEAITLEGGIDNYKIILVTDRVDLDDQIYKTFHHCGTVPVQAKTGKHLAELLRDNTARIITTVIDKFELAVSKTDVRDENPDIFVLVDESHRGQYGELHAKMKKALPNGCFIGFTGTPVMKKDKNTIERFGGLIDTYTIEQAVKDKAVVPLLYEGRHVDQKVDTESVDPWFERITGNLSREQKADLKRKFSSTDQLNKAQQKVMRIAWDVGEHFRDNWQGTPYKAQLVAQDKATALLYKKFLDDFGLVGCEVLISGPDEREGEEDVHEESTDEVKAFWKKMMAKYGSEKEYNRQVISAFKNAEQPEIIIVVDKLLTGFDAPRNTVLYLTRRLKGHSLLQAIARVNRLYDGKDFGYIIDYRGVLQNLDEALDIYGRLSEFDMAGLDDLSTALSDVRSEAQKLPQRHSDLWEVFKTVRNQQDEEAYELLLADEELRGKFYERLSAFSRTLGVALSSSAFLETTPEGKLRKYKSDLRFFMQLRTSVRKRYAEVVDFKEYEARIQKLVDQHVGTGEVEKITDLVNIFDADAFAKEVEKLDSAASKADTIAYRTKRTIHVRMQEDPAFYRRFSEMLEDAIRAFREQRLSDAEYLRNVREIAEKIKNRTGDDIPAELANHDVAKAFFGVLQDVLMRYAAEGFNPRSASTMASLAIDGIILQNRIVNWTNNTDVQNRMMSAIEDYLFDLKDQQRIDLTFEDVDRILEMVLDIARTRYA